jgi:hypothetical protein
MKNFSLAKAQTALKDVLILVAGIIGVKALKGIVESKFPQIAPYANWVLLGGAIAGTTMVNQTLLKGVSKGALLFSAVQLLNTYVPGSAKAYLPTISGVRGVGRLGNTKVIPMQPSNTIPDSAVALGNTGMSMGSMAL